MMCSCWELNLTHIRVYQSCHEWLFSARCWIGRYLLSVYDKNGHVGPDVHNAFWHFWGLFRQICHLQPTNHSFLIYFGAAFSSRHIPSPDASEQCWQWACLRTANSLTCVRIIGYVWFSLVSHSHVYELTVTRRGGGGDGICPQDCASIFTICCGDKKTDIIG